MSEIFKYQPTAAALQPMAFTAVCTCGQTIFAIGGLGMNIDIPDGMDIVAKCRCAREHSIATQVAEARAAQEAEAGDVLDTEPSPEVVVA